MKFLTALGLACLFFGCSIHRHREFLPTDGRREAEYMNWLIRPLVRDFGGSSVPRYDCTVLLTLIPERSNNVARRSEYLARIVQATLEVEGHKYESANPSNTYGGNQDSLPIYLLRFAGPVYVSPKTTFAEMRIVVDFLLPKIGKRHEEHFHFKLKQHDEYTLQYGY
jgi:hypothetical protein